MRFVVLGPVAVSQAGGQSAALAPRQRAVLAYLLLHAGTVISAERLIGAIWGMTPPDTARAQLQASIAAIRKVLRAVGTDEVLATRSAGYVIQPGPDQLDLQEFTGLLTTVADLDPTHAAQQIRRALALWQGEALADVSADFVAQARSRLEERRLSALEQMAELELQLGGHKALVDELTAHLAAHPLRERLARHLMLALHRSGRQPDALSIARTFRTTLADAQGLDPSRDFQQLEQSILRDDPSLAPPADVRTPEPESGPAQPLSFLPFDIPDFTGRAGELDRLADSWAKGGAVVTISAIDGMAGVGKTTLAVHAAHRLADRFPDGQLFVDLHAHTPGQPSIEPGAALETLLRQLGLPAERIPLSLTERAALWRSELVNRRTLIILDNASDTDHVRPLLPGATHSLMLITSRRRLIDLDGADLVSLEVLPAEDALALFTSIVGERAQAEPVAVLDVLQLCGFLPLAVRIAAARLRHRPRWSVAYLADRLRVQRRRLRELTTADRGVAAAFTLSYEQLEADQQRLFRLLGLHPGVDLDPHAAAALADLPAEDAEELLEDLLDAHMLIQTEPGRYTFHDLLREYARGIAAEDEDAQTRQDALTRLADHYRYTANTAVDVLFEGGAPGRPVLLAPSTPATSFADKGTAGAWLTDEAANLLAVAAEGLDEVTLDLASILYLYLDVNGRYHEAAAVHSDAVAAGRRLGDRDRTANALNNLAEAQFPLGRYDEAREHAREALELGRELGHKRHQARARTFLGALDTRRQDYTTARLHFEAALHLCREIGVRLGEASSLTNLGDISGRLRLFDDAVGYHLRALEIFREEGYRVGEAEALNNLGLASIEQGQFDRALDHLEVALTIYRDEAHPAGQADVLNSLGRAARAMAEPAQAVHHHTEALRIATEIGDVPQQARAHAGLAEATNDPNEAARAHELYTALGVPGPAD
ncbi:tetratricopeptide repeat protein [Streptosporangium sp. CA-135522]|uniref:AfsR/SARP family transcriptional regulator n=1 Tax=Streptosporangium sp. CA-135522 TaxID=3240072 RepID=UPI003D93EEFC